jgi:hypothetical protein
MLPGSLSRSSLPERQRPLAAPGKLKASSIRIGMPKVNKVRDPLDFSIYEVLKVSLPCNKEGRKPQCGSEDVKTDKTDDRRDDDSSTAARSTAAQVLRAKSGLSTVGVSYIVYNLKLVFFVGCLRGPSCYQIIHRLSFI